MKHQYAVWCLSIATLGMSGTANAAVEWWILLSRGKQPDREVFYADATSVVHVNKESGMTESARALDVLHVKEPAASPEIINYRLQFQCESKQMRVLSATAAMNSGANVRAPVPEGWMPVRPHWTERAYQFACQPQARQRNGMIKVEEATSLRKQETDMLGGFVGDLSADQVAERTRKAVWKIASTENDRTSGRGLYPKQIQEIRKQQLMGDIQTLFAAPDVVDLPK